MRIVTWNINSVRLRLPLVLQMIETLQPDVICLQEIKCRQDEFPSTALSKAGFPHQAINGIKGLHGVATIAREPFRGIDVKGFCGKEDGRHIMTRLGDGTELHNFYIPSGGDVPDPAENEKFEHKLDFVAELAKWWAERQAESDLKAVTVGDFNIAPLETDVWSHKQMLKVVSHTPVEVEGLNNVQAALSWHDAVRHFVPPEEKLYSWWSYRARDWAASNRGRRLDHIWVTPTLKDALRAAGIHREARGWEKPSDHVPVWADLDVG